MPRIYISHRPEDSSRNDVRLIRQRLIDEFGEDNVMDTAGDHMHTTLQRQAMVESCDVFLAVIGRYWLELVDEQGNNLLEDPYDPVHVELSQGHHSSRMIRVLLVDDVPKLQSQDLPEVLRWVATQSTNHANDTTQLESFMNGFVEQVSALPERPRNSRVSTPSQTSTGDNRVTPQEAQRVLQNNPPVPAPETSDPFSSGESQTSPWVIAILIGAIGFGFVLAFFEDTGRSGERVADSAEIAVTAIQSEPTTIPETNDTASPFVFVRHYPQTADQVGFSLLDDSSLYYEHISKLYIIDMDTATLNPIAVSRDDLVFENLIQSEPELLLTQEEIDQIEAELNDEIVFAGFDEDDDYFVIMTDQPRIVLVSGGEITLSRRIFVTIDNALIPNQTIVYDSTHNLLMVLVDDRKVITWIVADDVTMLDQRDITHGALRSVGRLMMSPNGEYLVAVGANGFSLYRIATALFSD